MRNTIFWSSKLGQRLDKIPKCESMYIRFEGKQIPVTSTIGIGRDKTNQICIEDDRLVSRNHAVIQKLKEAYFIKDLDSTNGTWVNNEKVPEGKYLRIRTSDIIRIGRTELTIRSFLD